MEGSNWFPKNVMLANRVHAMCKIWKAEGKEGSRVALGVVTTNLCCITSHKSEDLIYTMAEA
jgi:hypothetical protein